VHSNHGSFSYHFCHIRSLDVFLPCSRGQTARLVVVDPRIRSLLSQGSVTYAVDQGSVLGVSLMALHFQTKKERDRPVICDSERIIRLSVDCLAWDAIPQPATECNRPGAVKTKRTEQDTVQAESVTVNRIATRVGRYGPERPLVQRARPRSVSNLEPNAYLPGRSPRDRRDEPQSSHRKAAIPITRNGVVRPREGFDGGAASTGKGRSPARNIRETLFLEAVPSLISVFRDCDRCLLVRTPG